MGRIVRSLLKIFLVFFVLLNVVVICHAYKFTHYYNVGEANIKQQKDKSSWDKTKDILFGFDAVKQVNSKPDSSYKTVYLKTTNNLKLEAWLMQVPNPKGTVALFHGHGSKKSAILTEAYSFQQLGYNTLLLDFRAHGNSEGNTCTIGYNEAEDVQLAYNYLQQQGEKNIVLYGISLGAATITKAINDFGIAPQKVILEMPFGSLPDAVAGRVKIMGLPQEPISTMLTFWGGIQNGFWAFNLKPSEYAKKIKCPVLLQHGTNDPRVTQKDTKEIFDNITSSKKWVEYNASAHQSLCTNEHPKWMAEVAAFLQ